jgi:RNA recognition motif
MSKDSLIKEYETNLEYWERFDNVNTSSKLNYYKMHQKCEDCEERYILPTGTSSSLPIMPIYDGGRMCIVCKGLKLSKIRLGPTSREDVYKALDSERDYQEDTAKKWNHRGIPSLEGELLMMEHYLQLAREKWATSSNDEEVLEVMRKVSGITIRCFENHGVVEREKKKYSERLVYVSNLCYGVDDNALVKIFDGLKIESAHVCLRLNNRSRGCGFVKFSTQEDQKAALTKNGTLTAFGGRKLNVQIAKEGDDKIIRW